MKKVSGTGQWIAAIRAVDEKLDPAPLLALMDIPSSAAPFVKDLFYRRLGPGLESAGRRPALEYKDHTLARQPRARSQSDPASDRRKCGRSSAQGPSKDC